MQFKNSIFLLSFTMTLLFLKQATAQDGNSAIDRKLKTMGVVLADKDNRSAASIVGAVRVGNFVYLSGHGPDKADGTQMVGKIGKDFSIEEGREAAQLTAISLLRTLKAEISNLDKVKRVVKVLGMVNAVPEFTQQPQVMNGFSDFIVEVFGREKGQHARSAVGVASLPNNIAVEIEMIVELEN